MRAEANVWITLAFQDFGRLGSHYPAAAWQVRDQKLPSKEVPGQLASLCKSEGQGPDNLARDPTNQNQQAKTSLPSSFPQCLPLPCPPAKLSQRKNLFSQVLTWVLRYECFYLIRWFCSWSIAMVLRRLFSCVRIR